MIKKLLLLFVMIIAGLICNCSIAPNASGTTDTGNAKIAAVIYTNDGQPATGVPVLLLPSEFLPGIGADSTAMRIKNEKVTVTNDSGYFVFDSIDIGHYSIEINDRDSSAVLLKVAVSPVEKSTIFINDTLQPYATIKGNLGKVADTTTKRYLLLYGLDRLIPVANDGTFFANDLPAGTFNFRIVAESNTWIPIQIDSVVVISEKTVFIPYAGWSHQVNVTLNTTSTGANVGVNVYDFPLLIRLSGDNFDFNQTQKDGSDLRFFKSDGSQMAFDVEMWDSAQANACIWVRIDTVYGNNSEQSFSMLWGNPNVTSVSNSEVVFDSSKGFLGSYHFGGNLNDATANGYDGSNSGTTDIHDGIIGSARSFNGVSGYISLGDIPDRQAGTVSCWFRPAITVDSSLEKTQGIWGKKEADNINFSLSLRGKDYYIDSLIDTGSAGDLVSKLEDSTSGYYLSSTTSPFAAGTWYFLSWSWGENSCSLYINGNLESSASNSVAVFGDGIDEVGRSVYDVSNIPWGEARYFNGAIDEFRMENKARGVEWTRLCYMNQRSDDKLVIINW